MAPHRQAQRLLFVAHAAQAAPPVDVHREARTVESYPQEPRAKEEEARQCHEENARLRAERGGPGGLAGLFSSEEARGAFTLKLWVAAGVRTVTVGGVTFP